MHELRSANHLRVLRWLRDAAQKRILISGRIRQADRVSPRLRWTCYNGTPQVRQEAEPLMQARTVQQQWLDLEDNPNVIHPDVSRDDVNVLRSFFFAGFYSACRTIDELAKEGLHLDIIRVEIVKLIKECEEALEVNP